MSLAGGSGWAILDFNFHTGDLRTYWSGNHTQSVAFGEPLLRLRNEETPSAPQVESFEAQSRRPPARCLRFAVCVTAAHARLATGLLVSLWPGGIDPLGWSRQFQSPFILSSSGAKLSWRTSSSSSHRCSDQNGACPPLILAAQAHRYGSIPRSLPQTFSFLKSGGSRSLSKSSPSFSSTSRASSAVVKAKVLDWSCLRRTA